MSSGKRSSYELTTPAVDEERPHSFYDNLNTSSGSSGSRVIQIPDIQFKFDDDIPMGRSSALLMSNAKSDFFGLSKIPDEEPDDESDGRLLADRRTPPTIVPPAATTATSSSSPSSTASTVPAAPPGSPEDSPRSTSRPASAQRNITIRLPEEGAPSEAVYMTTTVPQNFAKNSSTLIGRHKPTRSSLRHSRMLVVNNKNYHQRFPKGNSLNLRHIRLSRLLMLLKVAIGAVLTFVGMTIIVWSPNTHTKDNPYWSGMILLLCGALFLFLFDFKRRPANRLRENFFNFVRINALVVLLLTIFFTMLAFIYALIHTTNLSSANLRCEPEYHFNVNSSSCVCLIDPRSPQEVAEAAMAVSDVRNEAAGGGGTGGYFDRNEDQEGEEDFGRMNLTTGLAVVASTIGPTIMSGLDLRKAAEQLEDEGVIRLEYRDFNCREVVSIWYYVTLGSTILNSIGCLLAAAFLVIYGVECQRREHELKYLSVRTTNGSEPMPAAPKISETAVQDSGGKEEDSDGEQTERPGSAAANVTEIIVNLNVSTV
ncbi:hypothetical protein pipiens_013902 [Culex pipiens pipiens]|uniref:Uncharacterized protein n=1 Tax=Culex pipiens pipiens TaxID=38569 RepID=A0ABD1CWV0_CULPP